MEETFLTAEEVCARYRNEITPKTLANWRCDNTGPKFTKIGNRVLYALSDLKAWEQSRKAETKPPAAE